VTWSRGQKCGDIELPGYLVNVTDPVALVLDLRIVHERWGSTSDPTLNGNLHYPNDIERSLNESDDDKIRKCHTDYNNNLPNSISFKPAIDTSKSEGSTRLTVTHIHSVVRGTGTPKNRDEVKRREV
jgi:hypothetical protein